MNLAYLQPFEDGNKRTNRLGADIPLLLFNCAHLSLPTSAPVSFAADDYIFYAAQADGKDRMLIVNGGL